MNKFRSWNETKQVFIYFFNGYYFNTLEGLKQYEEDLKKGVKGCYCTSNTNFDWNNAEECITINKSLFYSENAKDDVLKDVEFFEGDIVKMHFFYDDADPVSLGWIEGEKEIIGILKCENVGGAVILSEDKEYSYQLLQEPIEELERLGNIHENKEL